MSTELTLSVGMPAYNEQANIGGLLESLLAQQQTLYRLKHIIVVSDMSDDDTDSIVQSFAGRGVRLIRNTERLGAALSQNRIVEAFEGDVLALLNADVMPAGPRLLDQLVAPFRSDPNLGLVGGQAVPLPPETALEGIVGFSSGVSSGCTR